MRKNLKILRIQNDLTQDGMADRLGVSRTGYINVELGKSKGSIDFWLKVKKEFPDADIEELVKVRKKN